MLVTPRAIRGNHRQSEAIRGNSRQSADVGHREQVDELPHPVLDATLPEGPHEQVLGEGGCEKEARREGKAQEHVLGG